LSSPRTTASPCSISTTAWARLREGYAGLVGIVTTRWHRSSASLGRPLSSRPNSSAVGPASAWPRISLAASRGRCRLRLAVRPRAVNPTTGTQSAREHLVHEQIEAHPPADVRALPLGPRHGERHAKPALHPPPGAVHVLRAPRRVTRRPHA